MLHNGHPMCRFSVIGSILFFIVLWNPDFSRAASPAPDARLTDIIKRARDEKEIIFQIGEPHGKYSTAQTERQMGELVKKKFGIDLGIKFSFAQGYPAAAARALTEIKSGSFPTFDLMYQTTGTGIALYADNAIEPVPWRQLFDWVSEKDLNYAGRAIIVSTTFLLPSYNTNLVKPEQAPKTWEDILHPKWKGKLATTIYQDMWPIMAQPNVWGEAKTKEFLTKLSMQNPLLGRFNEIHAKLISGEVELSVLDSNYAVEHSRAKGAPVALAQIEPIIVFVRVVFVPQKSKRSNAGKLLAGALLTPEGQAILEDGWSASSLFRPGTPAAKFVAGKKLALPNVDFEKEKSLPLQKEFEKILVRR
jgi:iron(III) transport system substrate-binding protein